MNKFSSIFGQILQIFSKSEFYEAVRETKADKGVKGFSCWGQFVAMLFCQLGQAHSLREITGGLATCMGKLRHLGIEEAPKRSTLSYANNHRPWQMYERVFYTLLDKCKGLAQGKKKFRFKNKLFSLDSTIIELCASLFNWAKFRQTKGAVKLHLLLDHEGYLPVFANITEGRVHEVNIARRLSFPKGSIIVIDRGYVDYGLFAKWTEEGIYFVTRQKDNARFRVIRDNPIPERGKILRDSVIEFEGFYAKEDFPYQLRRIEVWDDTKGEVIVLLTNHLEFGPTTLAAIYKDRWQIEVFFKTIKQNLKIKTFVGTTPNAVMTQIWTALIAILALKYLKFRSTFGWSLSNLVALLRYNLFTYRDLWEWLNKPFETLPILYPKKSCDFFGTPIVPDVEQLPLRGI
ncbi:transposase [hot springs metagenome]|uniref:Transposase n=1 Tax=hot springs metagenome TaxID=433727 RepID=A0A5J4LB12_9ZZZZ